MEKKSDVFQIDLQLYLLLSCPFDGYRKILRWGLRLNWVPTSGSQLVDDAWKKGGINFGNSGMNPDLQQHWITDTRADLARDAAALLPCAVGMSCWRGTPGDPKGVTAGCWNIIPCRPTSIRDLLAWSGMQNTQYPQNAKKPPLPKKRDIEQENQNKGGKKHLAHGNDVCTPAGSCWEAPLPVFWITGFKHRAGKRCWNTE